VQENKKAAQSPVRLVWDARFKTLGHDTHYAQPG